MIISYNWLNNFFDNKAPDVKKLIDGLTMHSLEVEGAESKGNDTIFDVKVLPNLNHSCLCHRGIAKEVGAIFGIKVRDNSRELTDFKISETSKKLDISIEDYKLCRRYMGRVIENISVHESPLWLKEKIESIGQRSINNIVDATNFVMFEIGQPMHAFDAEKLSTNNIKISVQKAKAGDHITTLDKKEIDLDESVLLITDGSKPLAIAGIKGGTHAELDENTTNVVLESASFDPVLIRKTSQRLKIQTDASKRYENDYAVEMASEAMDILTRIIIEIAGTENTKIGEVIDCYPKKANKYKLGISSREVSSIIGTKITDSDIENIFNKFGFEYKKVKPVDSISQIAESLIGKPYKYGASISYDAPEFFDCSGFVSYLFAQSGIQMPRMSVDQYVWGKIIEKSEIKKGDVVFANTGDLKRKIDYKSVEFLPGTEVLSGVDHCGLYFGDGKIIHCTESKNGVVVEELDNSEKFKNIVGYRRMTDGEERFVITVPPERLDLRIKEDLAEDIGRVYGYEKIESISLRDQSDSTIINKDFCYKEKIRRELYKLGFSEVLNYTFRNTGEVELENPMSPERKFLRVNLVDGIKETLDFNVRYSEIVEMPQIKVFEFGHVFDNKGEYQRFIIGVKNPIGFKKPKEIDSISEAQKVVSEILGLEINKINKDENIAEYDWNEIILKTKDQKEYDFSSIGDNTKRFKKISSYPFMIRDIAVFTPEGTESKEVFDIISSEAGELMIKNRLFDVFTKKFPSATGEEDGLSKTSYAYRLIFQSYEKTLSDEEVNLIMQKITDKMNSNIGWQVR